MSFSRRKFLAGTGNAGLVALGATIPFEFVLAQGSPIKLGSVLDNSGNLDAYGKPMVMATTLAVEELNAAGGLLGRKIDLVQYDSQSNMALYTQYAKELTRSDKLMSCTVESHRLHVRLFAKPSVEQTPYIFTTCCTRAVCAIVISCAQVQRQHKPQSRLLRSRWKSGVIVPTY